VVSANATSTPSRTVVERVSISDVVDLFSDGGRRRLFNSLFKRSTLLEPTYKEVIVVHRPLAPQSSLSPISKLLRRARRRQPPPPPPEPVRVRVFSDVPCANILACLPKSKLVFRAADALRLDLVSLLGLLAILATLRFDSVYADVFAAASVAVWLIRLALRYSNSLARYDLLVNRFLKSKIVRRGLGPTHVSAGFRGRSAFVFLR
jgi:hypothetical protein